MENLIFRISGEEAIVLISKKRRRRLTLELLLMTLISLIAGVLTAQVVEDMGLQFMFEKLKSEDYYENQTQTQIAKALNISQVQVSRLEKKILRQMREKF